MKNKTLRIALLAGLAMAVLVTPAAAAWQEYDYPEMGFLVTFPADPKVETISYKGPGGAALPGRQYSLTEAGNLFRISVIDFSASTASKAEAIKQAVEGFRARGKVIEDTFARIDKEFGRNLNLAGKDGSHDVLSIYFVNRKLYLIEGLILPGSTQPQSGDPVRFKESLSFIAATAQGQGSK